MSQVDYFTGTIPRTRLFTRHRSGAVRDPVPELGVRSLSSRTMLDVARLLGGNDFSRVAC